MRLFDPPYGACILDVGGYVGATAIHYASKGHRVTSIEGSPIYCAEFERNVAAAEVGDKIELARCLFEEFRDPAAYDAACCTEVLNHVLDPQQVLRMIGTSLKPGGLVFVTTTQQMGHYDARHYTRESLAEQLAAAGFRADVELWADGQHTPQIVARGYCA